MLQKIRNMKGQSTLEYAILIIIIIAALLTLQTYIKRGISGRLASATDDIGDQWSQATAANYYKKVTTSSSTNDIFSKGTSETKMLKDQVTNTTRRIGSNAYGEYWAKPGQ